MALNNVAKIMAGWTLVVLCMRLICIASYREKATEECSKPFNNVRSDSHKSSASKNDYDVYDEPSCRASSVDSVEDIFKQEGHHIHLARAAPVVMDGRAMNLPMVTRYEAHRPLSITAWILIHLSEDSPLIEGKGKQAGTSDKQHSETTILSFARPIPRRYRESTNTSMPRFIAPGLHLGVGNGNSTQDGCLFFNAVTDRAAHLTGFFSPKPLPLNRWVHVALVVEPRDNTEEDQMIQLSGYLDGELQGRLNLEAHDLVTPPEIEEEEEEDYHRAVFVWGGVPSRSKTAMMKGLVQHADLHFNRALSQTSVRKLMRDHPPWTPIPKEIAEVLKLGTMEEEKDQSRLVRHQQLLPLPPRHHIASQWLQMAVKKSNDVQGKEEERMAHWYLMGAVLLDDPSLLEKPGGEIRGVKEEGGSWRRKRDNNDNGSELLLPPGAAGLLAQLILASHALEKATDERVLNDSYLHTYAQAIWNGQEDSVSNFVPRSSSLNETTEACELAVAHYLSVASWAVENYGAEMKDGDSLALMVQPIVEEESLLLEDGNEERFFRYKRKKETPPRYRHSVDAGRRRRMPWWSAGTATEEEEVNYMRVRAETERDPEALVWYAQALYWGNRGLQADRRAAARYMLEAAEMGYAEAQYNAGIMLLHGSDEEAMEPNPTLAEELVERAASQGYAPALAAKGLWALTRESEEDAEERNILREDARQLLETAVQEGENAEAHIALALLKGLGQVGLGKKQIVASVFFSKNDDTQLPGDMWEIAQHLASAASTGHTRAMLWLATALWDPLLSFDLTKNALSTPFNLTIGSHNLGRADLKMTSLQRSCSVATQLLRPAAEMIGSGLLKHHGSITEERIALAAEAGIFVAQIHRERTEREAAGLGKARTKRLAQDGWPPALRRLADGEKVAGRRRQALALYHVAGVQGEDSRAFYELALLLEEESLLKFQDLIELSLSYYQRSMATAKSLPYQVPPALAYALLWGKRQCKVHSVLIKALFWAFCEVIFWSMMFALLFQVLRHLSMYQRRRRIGRKRQETPESFSLSPAQREEEELFQRLDQASRPGIEPEIMAVKDLGRIEEEESEKPTAGLLVRDYSHRTNEESQ